MVPMLQQWNIRSRAHECAVSGRPFNDKEKHYTAIYFDAEAGGYSRRDVALESWEQELAERKPFSFWKSVYVKNTPDERPEIASKESGFSLLQRLIEEDDEYTENARYILALMLERKRVLAPTAVKETEKGRMLFYENKKTGDAFVIRDPELRLDEIASVQEEVAALLGFSTPEEQAAKEAALKKARREKRLKGGEGEPDPAEAATPPPEPPPAEVAPEAALSPGPSDPADPSNLSDASAPSEPECAQELHEESDPGL